MIGFRRTFILSAVICFIIFWGKDTLAQPIADNEFIYSGKSDCFIDWNEVDWKFLLPFPPKTYPASYNFNNLKYATPYLDFTHYRSDIVPLNLQDFRSLPPATRSTRKLAAEDALNDAMAFNRIMLLSWDIWKQGSSSQVAQEAWTYKYGILPPAISNFEKAVGIDPENPFTWQHLAFFTGLVGNTNRQLQALDNCLITLNDYEARTQNIPHEDNGDLNHMRIRLHLDRAWALREKAEFVLSQKDIKQAMALMAGDEVRTPALARESLVLEALLLVDLKRPYEAQQKANKLPPMKLPVLGSLSGSQPQSKANLHQVESDFCRQWIWDMSQMKLGNASRALRPPGYFAKFLEHPSHLGYRYWQDMGRIREHFGERESAWAYYFIGYMARPFLSFYPTQMTTGYTPIFGQEQTGNPHFLGFHQFFQGGSEFAYAANRVSRMERAFGPSQRTRLGAEAIEALSVCIKKGIRPLSAMALRGYAQNILNNFELAELDLHEADRLLTAADCENAIVIRQLATLHFNRKDYEGSHQLLVRYLAMEPNDSATWRFHGVVLAFMERYDEGLQSLDAALALEPDSTPALFNHALVQLRRGKVDQARLDLQKAQNLNPDNHEVNRLAQLVKDNPNSQMGFEHKPQKWSVRHQDSSDYSHDKTTAGISPKDLSELIAQQQDENVEKPVRESRLALAYSFKRGQQWENIQNLMAPYWPDMISLEGSILLLQADRSLGQSFRAQELANSLKTESGLIADPELWTLVAVICHENGERDSGNLALDVALELDPENRSLLMMQQYLGP